MFISTFSFFILKSREEEMTAKVMDLQTQLEELRNKYEERLQQEESPGNDKVRGIGLKSYHSLKTKTLKFLFSCYFILFLYCFL